MPDIDAARRFVALHARLLDRARFAHLIDGAPADHVLRALAAYANDDGGFGNALEPDVRAAASEPIAVLAALDVLHEAGAPPGHPLATGALDWLATIAHPDGGVPFLTAAAGSAPHAPFFDPPADPPSSLHMTAAVAAAALRLGAEHPWLDGATAYCWERLGEAEFAYEIKFVLDFLDAVPDRERAQAALAGVAERIPPDGRLPVRGGAPGEALEPTVLSPRPGGPVRALFDPAVIERALDDVAAGQRDDGGWDFSWTDWNPAVTWEWRGRLTVEKLALLRANGC